MLRQDVRPEGRNSALGTVARRLVLGLACGLQAALASLPAVAADGAAPPVTAPVSPDTVLRSADLRADTALLRQAYESLHPGLYRYRTRAEDIAAGRDAELATVMERIVAARTATGGLSAGQ